MSTSESVTMHEKTEESMDEDLEMGVYQHDLQALSECRTSFDSWYEKETSYDEEKRVRLTHNWS